MPKDQARDDRSSDRHWNLLLTELQGSQSEQRASGGGVDEILIARYLAGECDQGERRQVEEAARSSPEVRECIDIAREVLISESPEKARPAAATGVPQPAFSRLQHRNLPAVIFKWAVAASLLAILAGGGYALARIKSDLADARAELASKLPKLQEDRDEVARQTGAGMPAEVPKRILDMQTEIEAQRKALAALRAKQDEVAVGVGVDSLERIPQRVRELQTTIRERDEQVAGLRNAQERVAARIGVDSLEAIPPTVLALQQSIKGLRTELEDVGRNVAALKGPSGNCQSPTPNGNACVACYAPCVQPSPCAPQPPPCASGCAVPCQPPVATYQTPMATVTSYGPTDGWRPAQETVGVQPARASTVSSYFSTVPGTTRVSPAGGISWYPTSQAPVVATSAASPMSNATPAVRWVTPETHAVARPVVQTASPWTPTTPARPAQGPLVILDDGGWRAARE